ncbi:MAG: hypothetical protein HRU10_07245 [Opitutales bacterium]|nr:hypothetical protein [Opitutales bacterium]
MTGWKQSVSWIVGTLLAGFGAESHGQIGSEIVEHHLAVWQEHFERLSSQDRLERAIVEDALLVEMSIMAVDEPDTLLALYHSMLVQAFPRAKNWIEEAFIRSLGEKPDNFSRLMELPSPDRLYGVAQRGLRALMEIGLDPVVHSEAIAWVDRDLPSLSNQISQNLMIHHPEIAFARAANLALNQDGPQLWRGIARAPDAQTALRAAAYFIEKSDDLEAKGKALAQIRTEFVIEIFLDDPSQLLELLDGVKDPKRAAERLVHRMAKEDFAIAFEAAEVFLPSEKQRFSLEKRIVAAWQSDDVTAWYQYAHTFDLQRIAKVNPVLFYRGVPERQHRIAIDALIPVYEKFSAYLSTSDSTDPIYALVKKWSTEDAAAALHWIENDAPEFIWPTAHAAFLSSSAHHDIAFSLRAASQLESPEAAQRALLEIARIAADRDPMAMVSWLDDQPSDPGNRKLVRTFFSTLAGLSGEEALQAAYAMPEQFRGITYHPRAIENLDVEGVQEWFDWMGPELIAENTGRVLLGPRVMLDNPDALIDEVIPMLKPGGRTWYAVRNYFESLARLHFDVAERSVRNADLKARNASLDGVTRVLLDRQPEAYDDWLESFSETHDKDRIRRTFIDTFGHTDPEKAFDLALEIDPDSGMRLRGIERAFSALIQEGPPEVLSSIEADPRLSDVERSKVVEMWSASRAFE